MVQLSIAEFNDVLERNPLKGEVSSMLYRVLIGFFSEYSQNESYRIVGNILDIVDAFGRNERVFNKYGVYFSDVSVMAEKEDYLWIVDNTKDLTIGYEEAVASFGRAPTSCYVDSQDEEVLKAVSIFAESVVPRLSLWNCVQVESIAATRDAGRRDSSFEYVDLTDMFQKHNISLDSISDAVCANLVGLCSEVRALEKQGKIYFVRPKNANVQRMYTVIASMLLYEGYHFDFSPSGFQSIRDSFSCVLDRANMLLEDYLYKLGHPVDLALYSNRNNVFACIRNAKAMSNFDVVLRMMEVPVDFSNGRYFIREKVSERVKCAYSDIEPISLVEVFGLDAKFDTAVKNSMELNVLLGEFEKIIMESVQLENHQSINFTNTILYRRDGGVYLAYLMDVHADYVYMVLPLNHGYSRFMEKFTVDDYDKLFDVSILADSQRLIDFLHRNIRFTKEHFDKPKYTAGMIMRCAGVSSITLSENSLIDFISMGIWSAQTSACRSGRVTLLQEKFRRDKLRDKNILTYWGGGHPGAGVSFIIDSSMWR